MNDIVNKWMTPKATAGGVVKIIYILYVASIFSGLSGIIGVVIAYLYKDDSEEWLKSHYQFQIRTFWIGAIYLIISTILAFVLVGYLVFLFWAIWLVIRSVKGFKLVAQMKVHPNPTGWMF